MSKELTDLITKMNNTFEEMKTADQKRADEIKQYGQETQETKTQITKMNDEITKIQDQIKEIATKANRIGAGAGEQKSAGEIKKEEIFYKFMREGKQGLDREEKALVEDAVGEIIVPHDVDNEIYRALPQLNVIRGLANIRNTNSDRIRRVNMNELIVSWGKLETNKPNGYRMPESTLVPSEAFAYVEDAYGLTKIGEDELEDSNVNLQAYLADSFSQAMADLEELGFLRGTGHSTAQPEGILSQRGGVDIVSRFDTATTSLTADDMLSLPYQVKAQIMQKGSYLINPKIELAIRLMKDTQGQYLWQPSLQAGAPSTFGGRPIHLCSQMDEVATAGKEVAVFGDFNLGYQVLDRKQGFITRLNEIYIEDGLIGFRYKRRVGGYVRRPEAFKVLKVKA